MRELWRIIQSSVFLISQILMIVTAAGLYSWLLTTSGIPQQIVAEINAMQLPPWALLLSINVMLLIMGSFLEPPAAILILTPLLLPLVQAVGVDPDPLRHHHGGQSEHRHVHAAVRAEPVRLAGGVPDAARQHLSRRAAVPGDQFRRR